MNRGEFEGLKVRFGADVASWPAPFRREALLFLATDRRDTISEEEQLDRLVLEATIEPTDERALARNVLAKSRCRSADPSACRSVSDRGRCRRQPRAWHLFLQCQRSVATWPPVWKRRYRTMLSWRLLSVFRLLSLRRPLLSHEATEAACETIFMAASASVRRLRSIAGRKLLLARVRSEKPA